MSSRVRITDNTSSNDLFTLWIRESNKSYIDRIPSEIIDYIFSLCIDDDQFDSSTNRLRLSWVCQLWRHVIINNPLFWTKINYMDNPELVATFIMRSRERKLSIELWHYVFECPRKIALLKSTLISEAYRIEYIEVGLLSSHLKSIRGALCRPFPSLRHLSFCGDYDDEIPFIRSQIPFALDISKLEVFEMEFSSRVPWSSLRAVISKVRKLRIEFDRPESVISFFDDIKSFSGLEILSLSISCGFQNLPQIPSVALPNVTALLIQERITYTGPLQANPHPPTPLVINHLRVPKLQYLVTSDYKGYTSIFHVDFDYASIRYVSIIADINESPGLSSLSSFCLMGSAKKDKPRDEWWLSPYEYFLSNSSYEKQFQLMATFNQEVAGFASSFAALNELLPKMPGVRELCLPSSPFLNSRLCNTLLHPELMKHYPSLTGFHLIRSTSDMHIYGRGPILSS